MAYSFLSIPLALKYLGKTEYGLWALVLSITTYLNLSELGMTNSVQRHLIDLKDRRPDRQFGAIFLTGAMAFGAIGLVCLIVGGAGVHFVAPLFRISGAYETTFEWLLLGSVALFSLSLGTRILGVPLYVYQRHDLNECANIVLYLIWFFVLWAGLHAGFGVYSLLLSQGVGFVWTCGYNVAVCTRLSLYPGRYEWSCPSGDMIREIAIYSRDSFLQQVGQQIVRTLPMLLITRWIGLDAAAVWAVATRPFFILQQILGRPFQYGVSMLADLFSNKGVEVMMTRWMQLSQLMTAGALAMYPVCIVYNRAFLEVWTHGKIAWGGWNDLAYGLYTYLLVALFPWYGIVGINKKFGITRITSLMEAVLLAVLCWAFSKSLGITGFILALTISKLLFGLVPSLFYLRGVFGKPVWAVFRNAQLRPMLAAPFCIASAVIPVTFILLEPGWGSLIFCMALSTASSMSCVFMLGVSREVRCELVVKVKGVFRLGGCS
jgi:O-antigen/teichoic acid export membrane protein